MSQNSDRDSVDRTTRVVVCTVGGGARSVRRSVFLSVSGKINLEVLLVFGRKISQGQLSAISKQFTIHVCIQGSVDLFLKRKADHFR